jgi:tetratricopeptide (TPR) repeat protein
MKHIGILIFLWVCLAGYTSARADSLDIDYFSPPNIRKFARFLYQEKDYLRAAGEYQRFLVFSNSANDSALYKIANCYEKANQLEKSIVYYRKVYTDYRTSQLAELSGYQIAYNLHLQKYYQQSNQYIDNILPDLYNEELKANLKHLSGINLIYKDNWQEAIDYFSIVEQSVNDKSMKRKFQEGKKFAEARFDIPTKSPAKAGILSTVIPGTGKMYTGQVGDGIYSLILVGVSGFLAWDGFHDKGIHSTQGWIFGSIAGVLYFGNIYGSVNSAHRYNEKQLQIYKNGFDPQIYYYNEINF